MRHNTGRYTYDGLGQVNTMRRIKDLSGQRSDWPGLSHLIAILFQKKCNAVEEGHVYAAYGQSSQHRGAHSAGHVQCVLDGNQLESDDKQR